HRVDHQPKRGIDDCAGFFGVEILLELRGALDVGKQRGDRLALAFEILRGGRLSYSNRRIIRFLCRGSHRGRSQRRATLSTKAFARWIIGTAFRTKIRERRATITAELLASWIFSFAIRAAHRFDLLRQGQAPLLSLGARRALHGRQRTKVQGSPLPKEV